MNDQQPARLRENAVGRPAKWVDEAAGDERAEVVVERSPFDRYTVWVRGMDGFSN